MFEVSEARRGALVVGSTGLIGQSLMQALLRSFWPVWGTVRSATDSSDRLLALDLSRDVPGSGDEEKRLAEAARSLGTAFLCAAISRFEECAKNPDLSFRVNVSNTLKLAEFLLDRGVTVVYLSSNAVFDGNSAYCDEEAPHSPVTEYGRQKAAAEAGLRVLAAEGEKPSRTVIIVRLTKVLSARLPLVANWIGSLEARKTVEAFDDLIFAPTSLRFTTEALLRLSSIHRPGVYHISGDRDVSYCDFACLLARRIGAGGNLVTAASASARLGEAAFQPGFSALGTGQTALAAGITPQSLEAVVDDIVEEMQHRN